MGRKGPRNPPREGLVLTQQRQVSMGKRGPRIRPRDDDVGAHPAESPPGSRQRMSQHAIGWFMRNNVERAFANMNDHQLNDVSETLNTEMDMRESTAEGPERPRGRRAGEAASAAAADETARPRGDRGTSRVGRDRSRPPPGGTETAQEAEEANEPGSRARSRSKAVTRRRAQWREEHGMPPREEELQQEAEARAAAAAQQDDEEVELGDADFGTDSPPRGAARWRHGGNKAEHVPRAAEPDMPVSYDSPGVARPGEGRLRVIGNAEVPAIPNVPALPDDAQPMARLRDCLGMHDRAYPPRVMRALREQMEKKPKNVSFSEDNGHWMPQGSRFEFKVCPRNTAVPTDWRHRWSRKWTWSLWPAGNVPGTWIWYADEEGITPSDIHFWPSDGRPILACVYLCPTETYKAAQHASIGHVQSGRKHSTGLMSTCQTCTDKPPPRENQPKQQRYRKEMSQHPFPPREILVSVQHLSCPTSMFTRKQPPTNHMHGTGIGMAPSPATTASIAWLKHCLVAWDKRERLGEAKNPGPEPPREIWLRRKNGQRDPLRLCTQNGGWVWNMHYAPPLRVAKRPTPHEALRNWLTKHEPAIEPESVDAARQLAQAWEEFPVPQPIRRTRSLPPREIESMVHTQTTNSNTPWEKQTSNSQPEPLTRRRLRGKTSLPPSPPSPNSFCPAEPIDDPDSQDSEGRPEPYGCWDEIYDILRKPVLVDRHVPRELKTLWQRVVIQLLDTEQSRTDLYPIASDLVFILPKLVLSRPPGKEKGKARIHRIQECLRRASQGEWPFLIERTLQMETPNQEPDASQPLASGPDTLPPRIAKRLYRAASQGQLGKAWRQLRAPPPVHVGPEQWEEAVNKLTPHKNPDDYVPLREGIAPDRWHPTPREYSNAILKLKRNKAADAGGWTTETAQSCTDHPQLKEAIFRWIHNQAIATAGPARRVGLWRTHRLVCLDKGGGAIRPILIGMIWSKLLSHLLLQPAKSDLEPFLKHRQFGIGTPQG